MQHIFQCTRPIKYSKPHILFIRLNLHLFAIYTSFFVFIFWLCVSCVRGVDCRQKMFQMGSMKLMQCMGCSRNIVMNCNQFRCCSGFHWPILSLAQFELTISIVSTRYSFRNKNECTVAGFHCKFNSVEYSLVIHSSLNVTLHTRFFLLYFGRYRIAFAGRIRIETHFKCFTHCTTNTGKKQQREMEQSTYTKIVIKQLYFVLLFALLIFMWIRLLIGVCKQRPFACLF